MLGKQLIILMREFINTKWRNLVNMDLLNCISRTEHAQRLKHKINWQKLFGFS